MKKSTVNSRNIRKLRNSASAWRTLLPFTSGLSGKPGKYRAI